MQYVPVFPADMPEAEMLTEKLEACGGVPTLDLVPFFAAVEADE